MRKNVSFLILSRMILWAGILGVTGCATNSYQEFYASNTKVLPHVEQMPVKYPFLDEIFDLSEVQHWRRKGYEVIGQSSFRGLWSARTKAIDVARKNKAKVILVYYQLEEEKQEESTVILPQNSTSYHQGTAFYNGNVGSYSGYTTTTTYVPLTFKYINRYYAQKAFYLAKRKSLNAYGIYFLVPDNIPGRSENAPVVVDVVLDNSPADRAGIKAGDVIQSINGNLIQSFAEAQPYMWGQEEITSIEVKHE